MARQWIGFAALTIAVIIGLDIGIAQAQEIPQPDTQGNYFSNAAPVKGSAPSPLMAGSLWQVVSQALNCRQAPSISAAIVTRFNRGDVLQAEVYRGGSDEVLQNAKDDAGQPWMAVRRKTLEDTCFVRANQRYIQPFKDE